MKMYKLSVLFLSLLASCHASLFESKLGRQYLFFSDADMTFPEAQEACESFGTYMFYPQSQAELDMVEKRWKSQYSGCSGTAFVGANKQSDGTWRYENGENVNITMFHSSADSASEIAQHECLVYFCSDKAVYKKSCTDRRGLICQIDPSDRFVRQIRVALQVDKIERLQEKLRKARKISMGKHAEISSTLVQLFKEIAPSNSSDMG